MITKIMDDMVFVPYVYKGEWQCIVPCELGRFSVRYNEPGISGLMTDKKHPYEVWYPTEDTPIGYQTAEDIWTYIRKISTPEKI